MRCEVAQRAVSAAADGDLDSAARERLAGHLAGCDACTGFERSITALRGQLRVEAVDSAPDVVADVLLAIAASSPSSATSSTPSLPPVPPDADTPDRLVVRLRPIAAAVWSRVPAGAAAAIGFLAGASYVGFGSNPSSPAAADLPQRIVSLQASVTAVAADIEVTEYGRPDRSGPRQFDGHLAYGGPEQLQLSLREVARSRARAIGSSTPGDGDVQLSVAGDHWRLESVRGCTPMQGRAACPGGATRVVREVDGRAPFSEAAPIPLELVTPVDSFTLASSPTSLGERTIAGRSAIGVTLPASQAASFLDELSPADDLRAVYPTDPVEMWLDRESLVPLSLVVTAAPGPERQRWAAREGYDDLASEPILEFSATDVRVNEAPVADTGSSFGDRNESDERDDDRPAGAATPYSTDASADDASVRHSDEGFEPGDAPSVPTPAALAPDFVAARSGTVHSRGGPVVQVRSWTDGRAWVKVEATDEWDASHLFGGLGGAVRTVDLGPAGRGYLSADGHKVALHTDGLDLVVTGSLPTADLVELAGSLGLQGRNAPDGWREADATTLATAASELPGLLAPSALDGFGRPAVSVTPGETVTQVYAGPGDRGFVLTQSATAELPPPADDALGVEVRGLPGRYSVEQALLEWSEGGASFSLASPTLPLTELLDIAATLTPR